MTSLDFSRLKRKKLDLEISPTDLNKSFGRPEFIVAGPESQELAYSVV